MVRPRIFAKPREICTRQGRRQAITYMRWSDHGLLRAFWHNMHEISPGVFRSNYPDPGRIAALAERGVRTVISLRGRGANPWSLLEAEACERYGIELHCVALKAKASPNRDALLELISLFRRVEKPLLIHCKSGADRAGLASAIYLMVIDGEPVSRARRMLAARYLHLPFLGTGILGCLLDEFSASGFRGFEAWVTEAYDAEALQAKFEARRRGDMNRSSNSP